MAEKVTLESLDARMDKTDARLDRVEADLATVKTDVGTLKSQVTELTVSHQRMESDISSMRTEILDALEDISLQQKSTTAAMMEAVTQLNLSRTYEKRLVRLEEAVFGKVD